MQTFIESIELARKRGLQDAGKYNLMNGLCVKYQ